MEEVQEESMENAIDNELKAQDEIKKKGLNLPPSQGIRDPKKDKDPLEGEDIGLQEDSFLLSRKVSEEDLLVQNESLRLRITQLYENMYGEVRKRSEFDQGVVFDVLRPYYLAHFSNLSFGQRATPLNYDALRVDPIYQNMLTYRADFLRRAVINPYRYVIEEIDSLLTDLDEELKNK